MSHEDHIIPIATQVIQLQIQADMQGMFDNLNLKNLIIPKAQLCGEKKFNQEYVEEMELRLKEHGSLQLIKLVSQGLLKF